MATTDSAYLYSKIRAFGLQLCLLYQPELPREETTAHLGYSVYHHCFNE
ncbi:hypothetical protein Slin15195_G129960 [Septoria linicola]|uniref:Uncharacterized protein n=1 Tax=Septoria linicola TaxID=215465 RepID=A0A9Q9B0W6_9PEZI|nr:hypothetical protein Slin15195_G129960 [Septoria linicola]